MTQPSLIDQLRETSIEAPPPHGVERLCAIPIIHELGIVYLILHHAIRDFEKLERFTIGVMMEKVLLECIETCFAATTAPIAEKRSTLTRASALFDTLKLYIRFSVRLHCLQEPTYLKLIPHLGDIGKMLGGWIRSPAANPTPSSKSESNSKFQVQI